MNSIPTLSPEELTVLLSSERLEVLKAQAQNIADFAELDAHLYVRGSDLELLTRFGELRPLEGCLYLCSLSHRKGAEA